MRVMLGCALLLAGCLGDYSGGPGNANGNGSANGNGNANASGDTGGNTTVDPAPAGAPDYYSVVLPIFEKNCLGCHGSAGASPRLDTFEAAQPAANAIAAAVMSKIMPPFPPADGCNSYVDERRLSPADMQSIAMWVNTGAHAGDPSEMKPWTPPAPQTLGTPDKHLVGGPFTPTYPGSAGPNDLYWCFVLDPQLGGASRDLIGLQINPGVVSEVHHVIMFRDAGGSASQGKGSSFECNGAPAEMISGWVPGSRPMQLPDGIGMTIDPSDKLLMQVHYHRDPVAAPASDSTSVDLYFSPQPTPQHAYVVWAGTPLFTIPANAKGYKVSSTCTANGSWKVLGIAPHMHQHATSFSSSMTVSGQTECLMSIPQWDFNWQGGYFLQNPVQLASGDQIATTCTYDNPSASQIKFGEATTDEMCFGFTYVVAAARPTFSSFVNLFGGTSAASICAQ